MTAASGSTVSSAPAPFGTQGAHSARRGAGWLGIALIAEALLALVPILILGPAIGWPASLGMPAAAQLQGIHAQPEMVSLGYGVYLVYSVLVAPLMIGLASRTFGGLAGSWAATVAAFASLSAIARAIGILRWLTVMPVLAIAHAGGTLEVRERIELVFDAVNAFGGGIGEFLGVALFMALALGTLSLGAWLKGGMPGWLAVLGAVSAALLASLMIPAFGGPEVVPIAVAATGVSVWMLGAGIWCLGRIRGSRSKPDGGRAVP